MAGRKSDLVKSEHRLVVQALEVANLAYQRVVSVEEVVEALLPKDAEELENKYANPLQKQVTKILAQLLTRDLIFSPGKTSQHRYYGSKNILNPLTATLPARRSRRSRVLTLVKDVVVLLERAVRVSDVVEYAARQPEFDDLPPELIVRSLLSLAETGELLTKAIRGDGGGINLYLPANFDFDLYMPREPLTLMEEIARYIENFWNERVKRANERGCKPRPFSTGEFRRYISDKDFLFSPDPRHDPRFLVNAVKALSQTRTALLRVIRRPREKSLLWAPVAVGDDDLSFDSAYANDMERIGESVYRATDRLGRPVNIHEIAEEIDLDSALRPTGSSSLISVVSEAAKESIDAGNGTRQKRVSRRVYRIGQLNGTTYFASDDTPEAQNYLHLCHLKSRWVDVRPEVRIDKIECASLLPLRIGRVKLIKTEVEALDGELADMLRVGRMTDATRREAEAMRLNVKKALTAVDNWLAANVIHSLAIASEVNLTVPGWTAAELYAFMVPLSPRLMKMGSHRKLIGIMKQNIRRVPNPDYVHCFSKEARAAFHYLYDITDALIYSAKQWGGYECSSQAMIASVELERLRDVRFVLPALEAENYNTRLAAVACLAFLRSDVSERRLKEVAVHDPDPGVRRSAIWAYCFAGYEGAEELLHNRANSDPNAEVRRFSRDALNLEATAWWVM